MVGGWADICPSLQRLSNYKLNILAFDECLSLLAAAVPLTSFELAGDVNESPPGGNIEP